MIKRISYALAVAFTVAAFFTPWANYGGINIGLTRFPGWPVYLAGAVVLHVCTFWNTRAGRITAGAGGVVALVSAVVLMSRYGDSEVFFDGVIPAVFAIVGLGGVFAIGGVLLNVVATTHLR